MPCQNHTTATTEHNSCLAYTYIPHARDLSYSRAIYRTEGRFPNPDYAQGTKEQKIVTFKTCCKQECFLDGATLGLDVFLHNCPGLTLDSDILKMKKITGRKRWYEVMQRNQTNKQSLHKTRRSDYQRVQLQYICAGRKTLKAQSAMHNCNRCDHDTDDHNNMDLNVFFAVEASTVKGNSPYAYHLYNNRLWSAHLLFLTLPVPPI